MLVECHDADLKQKVRVALPEMWQTSPPPEPATDVKTCMHTSDSARDVANLLTLHTARDVTNLYSTDPARDVVNQPISVSARDVTNLHTSILYF